MTEGIADAYDDANPAHEALYEGWSKGGAGLLITGNVLVDRRYLERPGNVVLDAQTDREALSRWARAGTAGNNHLWMQLYLLAERKPPDRNHGMRTALFGHFARDFRKGVARKRHGKRPPEDGAKP